MALKLVGQDLISKCSSDVLFARLQSCSVRYCKNYLCYGLKGNTGARRWTDLAEITQQV